MLYAVCFQNVQASYNGRRCYRLEDAYFKVTTIVVYDDEYILSGR